jgi:Xaa-Pro aminopeptidase
MNSFRNFVVVTLAGFALSSTAFPQALQKASFATMHSRRAALAAKLNGGVAILFAAEQPLVDFMPYRQDEDFYYLTGWNEPGAALMIVSSKAAGTGTSLAGSPADQARAYREVLFLPTRNLRMEKYTGIKLDAATPNAAQTAGVDQVLAMTELPAELNKLAVADRRVIGNLWAEPGSDQAKALVNFTSVTLGMDTVPNTHDLSAPTTELRVVKDAGELALLKKASDASMAAQRVMMQATRPGVTERAIAGTILAELMAQRQREIYDVVLGAQRAAAAAFVAGKSTINDAGHRDPNSLDTVAWNYINTHGKGLHGEPLSNYWIHGLGHMVGINVHDPAIYPAVLKPGMVFTIEPGVYIPEEKIGVRIEDVFVVGEDGKLIDLVGDLPHTADDVEAAMKAK